MDTPDIQAKARALLDGIRGALAEGTRHYDKQGHELTTVRAILEALKRDGEVEIIPPAFGNVIPIQHGKKRKQ